MTRVANDRVMLRPAHEGRPDGFITPAELAAGTPMQLGPDLGLRRPMQQVPAASQHAPVQAQGAPAVPAAPAPVTQAYVTPVQPVQSMPTAQMPPVARPVPTTVAQWSPPQGNPFVPPQTAAPAYPSPYGTTAGPHQDLVQPSSTTGGQPAQYYPPAPPPSFAPPPPPPSYGAEQDVVPEPEPEPLVPGIIATAVTHRPSDVVRDETALELLRTVFGLEDRSELALLSALADTAKAHQISLRAVQRLLNRVYGDR